MTGSDPTADADPDPPLPGPGGPVDPTVPTSPVEEVPRPGRFTLMAPGWMPPTGLVTQALGLCFTAEGLVVMSGRPQPPSSICQRCAGVDAVPSAERERGMPLRGRGALASQRTSGLRSRASWSLRSITVAPEATGRSATAPQVASRPNSRKKS